MNEINTGEIVLYQPDETIRLEVRIEDETVWLLTSTRDTLNLPDCQSVRISGECAFISDY